MNKIKFFKGDLKDMQKGSKWLVKPILFN